MMLVRFIRTGVVAATLLLLCTSGVARASIQIDFDDLTPGNAETGDLIKQVGAFEAKIGPLPGSIVDNSVTPLAPFSGNYLSTVYGAADGVEDYSVRINFNMPIYGEVSFDANYGNAGAVDFLVRAIIDGSPVNVFQLADGPNNGSFSFNLPSAATGLIFRDSNAVAVAIDNLEINPVPEFASLAVWGLLGCCAAGFVVRRQSRGH